MGTGSSFPKASRGRGLAWPPWQHVEGEVSLCP